MCVCLCSCRKQVGLLATWLSIGFSRSTPALEPCLYKQKCARLRLGQKSRWPIILQRQILNPVCGYRDLKAYTWDLTRISISDPYSVFIARAEPCFSARRERAFWPRREQRAGRRRVRGLLAGWRIGAVVSRQLDVTGTGGSGIIGLRHSLPVRVVGPAAL